MDGWMDLPAVVEALVLVVAAGVVLVGPVMTNVVVVVHLLGVLLCVVVSLDLVGLVHALGLGELVDLGTGKTSQQGLGGTVADVLAWLLSVWMDAWPIGLEYVCSVGTWTWTHPRCAACSQKPSYRQKKQHRQSVRGRTCPRASDRSRRHHGEPCQIRLVQDMVSGIFVG